MSIDPAKLLESVYQFLEALKAVRICPDRIDAPNEQLNVNIVSLAVVVVIFALARNFVAGSNPGFASDIFAIIVSTMATFVTGFIIFVLSRNPTTERAKKWGAFFVMTWVISLIVAILLDGIAIWNTQNPAATPTSKIIDFVFGEDTLAPLVKNAMRAVIIGIPALAILLIKTWIADPAFSALSKCSIVTLALGLCMNTLMLLLFLYGNFI